jgi:uncharacterized protein YfaT (DUF1175 family)
LREALRPHTAEWLRLARLPEGRLAPDIEARPQPVDGALPLFRVVSHPAHYAEFADARTIIGLNAHPVGRDVRSVRPGDLLYFRQTGQTLPDHLMVFVGPTLSDRTREDWVVYHTGPEAGRTGEVRKVPLADLLRHPAPRWRPSVINDAFVGVYRLKLLW